MNVRLITLITKTRHSLHPLHLTLKPPPKQTSQKKQSPDPKSFKTRSIRLFSKRPTRWGRNTPTLLRNGFNKYPRISRPESGNSLPCSHQARTTGLDQRTWATTENNREAKYWLLRRPAKRRLRKRQNGGAPSPDSWKTACKGALTMPRFRRLLAKLTN